MTEPKAIIVIPTYNRSRLLRGALASALGQDYPDFRVVVLDNASSDDTADVVASFRDPRLVYRRNETNLGMLGNLNRALEVNASPYLTLLLDDDLLLPGFLSRAVAFLEAHPTVGLCFALARYIDAEGAPLHIAAVDLPPGVIDGFEYLHRNAGQRHGGCLSSVLMRASTLAAAGPFDSPHTKHTLDLNLYLRLARHGDVGFIPEELAQVRLHPDQVSEREWGESRLGYLAEYIDAIAYLLESPRAQDAAYRSWLAQRLLELNARQSESFHPVVPNLHLSPQEKLETAVRELLARIPPGERFLLIDEQEWGPDILPDREAVPFLEREGQYWGPPPDDETAIRELERMRRAGVHFLVFAWPGFWWMDHYVGLHEHLCRNHPCVLRNRRVVVFDLRETA